MSTLMRCISRTYRLYGSICTNDECSVEISGGGRFCISNKVACATFNKTLRTWVEVDKCISCKVELQHACIQAQASCKTLYSRCTAARSSWRASARPPERGPALSDRRPCPGQSQQFPQNCSPNGISHLRDACPGHPFVAQGMAMVNTVAALTFKSWGKLAEFTPASCLIWCERPIILLVYMLMCCKSFVAARSTSRSPFAPVYGCVPKSMPDTTNDSSALFGRGEIDSLLYHSEFNIQVVASAF